MIAIVDYGMGNLRSAEKGFERAGHAARVTDKADEIAAADAVVLPGVGAFKDCYEGLCSRGLDGPVREAAESGRPFLGICVGMQLLFDWGEEGAGSPGLGLLPGRVVRFPDARSTGLKVPHMGWNRLKATGVDTCPILPDASSEPYAYFVHSYYAQAENADHVLATCDYGMEFPAIVGRDNILAVQFHPEKSQETGIEILRAFGDLCQVGT